METTRISDILDSPKWLKQTDFENFFNVYVDKRQNYVFNLNTSIYLNMSDSSLQTYQLTHDMHWPLISYMLYGSTRFAWLLLKINNVSTADVFKIKHNGDVIKYLNKDRLPGIVQVINEER